MKKAKKRSVTRKTRSTETTWSAAINPPNNKGLRTDLYLRTLRSAQGKNPNWDVISKNLDEAIDRGDARAVYAKATWYMHGFEPLGISRNLKKALPLLRKAARGEIPDALYDLAVSFELGEFGTKKSKVKAFELYTEAAMLGDPDAQDALRRFYYYGMAPKKSRAVANLWRAAAQSGKVLR